MARTILMTIQDNETAETFVRDFLVGQEHGESGIMMTPIEGVTLDAMVARPTKYCKCTPTQMRAGRNGPKIVRNFTRTPRFGWFVCNICKRPTKTVVQKFIANHLTNLRDLLPELDAERESASMETSFMEAVARQEMAS